MWRKGTLHSSHAGNLVPADARLSQSANLRVVEAALTGESALDPALTTRFFDALRRHSAAQDRTEQLTEREREILRLLAAGHDNRTSAARLPYPRKPSATA